MHLFNCCLFEQAWPLLARFVNSLAEFIGAPSALHLQSLRQMLSCKELLPAMWSTAQGGPVKYDVVQTCILNLKALAGNCCNGFRFGPGRISTDLGTGFLLRGGLANRTPLSSYASDAIGAGNCRTSITQQLRAPAGHMLASNLYPWLLGLDAQRLWQVLVLLGEKWLWAHGAAELARQENLVTMVILPQRASFRAGTAACKESQV